MRAPSADLLRALRSATTAKTSLRPHPNLGPACNRLSIHPHRRQLPTPSAHSHSFHTSRQYAYAAPPSSPSSPTQRAPRPPKTHDRGPTSTETTQTDFSAMDIFNNSNVNVPATSIDACTPDGFHLDNGIKTAGGDGLLLLGGEAFTWRPWLMGKENSTSLSSAAGANTLLSPTGVLFFPPPSLTLLTLLHPKPDLLLVGTGDKLWMLSPETRQYFASLGMKVDVMDTGNASAAYNLLARERGTEGGSGVGGLFLPIGWSGKRR